MSQDDFVDVQRAYLQELLEQVEEMESYFLEYEKTKDESLIRKSISLMHSMKGAAGSYMLNEFSSLCHKVEDLLLDEQIIADKKFTQIIFSVIDLCRNYIYNWQPNQLQFLTMQLDELLDDFSLKQYRKCLILEMSRSMSKLYSNLVKKFGFNISFSSDSFEALNRLVLEDFDLILFSTNMGSFEGNLLFNAVQEIAPNKFNSTEVLVISTQKNSKEKFHGFSGDLLLKDRNIMENLENWLMKKYASFDADAGKYSESKVDDLAKLKNIVFIDDSEAILKLAKHVFEKQLKTTEVHYFSSGSEALKYMEKNQPELIICDYQMDHMDGIEIKNRVNQNFKLKNIPFLFLTGEREAKILDQMRKLETQGLIKKPFNHRSLLSEISTALAANSKVA
ncbi:MAG: response regulator [Bdellovibrionota bacterium]|nr:response regulator [Bdellovibrionota bacterium]